MKRVLWKLDKYIEMIRIRFLMMLAYRTDYYTGILIYSINIGAYYFLWTAIYGGKEQIQGLSVVQMTTYVAVSWMARAFYFNNIDREMAQEIMDGKVAVELIRPYNYLGMKTMQGLGEGIFRLFFLFNSRANHCLLCFPDTVNLGFRCLGLICHFDFIKFFH